MYHGRTLNPGVVIPRIGSKSTRFGAAVVRQFEGIGVRTTVTPGGILRARDKLATLQALAAAGVPVPLTSAAKTPSGLAEVLDLVGGTPVVVKLVEGTHGSGVVLAETRKAAESLLAAFHQLDGEFCVQAFVKEAQGEDLRAFVVDGRVVAAMRRKAAAGEFRANLHQGGEAFPVELDRVEVETAIAAAACVGVSVAGVDLLRTTSGPLVLEVNVSPGLQGIERASGVNVAAEVVDYARRLCQRAGVPAEDGINAYA
jgi:ribosomal protein S6--L-glutamate ligase